MSDFELRLRKHLDWIECDDFHGEKDEEIMREYKELLDYYWDKFMDYDRIQADIGCSWDKAMRPIRERVMKKIMEQEAQKVNKAEKTA